MVELTWLWKADEFLEDRFWISILMNWPSPLLLSDRLARFRGSLEQGDLR
jgi:hypothetical protein